MPIFLIYRLFAIYIYNAHQVNTIRRLWRKLLTYWPTPTLKSVTRDMCEWLIVNMNMNMNKRKHDE